MDSGKKIFNSAESFSITLATRISGFFLLWGKIAALLPHRLTKKTVYTIFKQRGMQCVFQGQRYQEETK